MTLKNTFKGFLAFLFILLGIHTNLLAKSRSEAYMSIFDEKSHEMYDSINEQCPDLRYETFRYALAGYVRLSMENMLSNRGLLTIIDFSLSANKERMWVIDLKHKDVLVQSLVAHGRSSGEEFAHSFSNTAQSYMSSLGFYVTGDPYIGKNGLSLRLNGVEKGINDNACERGVVLHGAEYVSENYIKANGRLGRSQGCPAVPVSINSLLCQLLAFKTCMFCYYPDRNYFSRSHYTWVDKNAWWDEFFN
jgi:hypothetical protein